MDVHRPRRPVHANLSFAVRRNAVGTRLARAAATKTVAGSAQPRMKLEVSARARTATAERLSKPQVLLELSLSHGLAP